MAFEKVAWWEWLFWEKKKITEGGMGRGAGGCTHLVSLEIRLKTTCQVPALNSEASA